jgi:hypothetical protein
MRRRLTQLGFLMSRLIGQPFALEALQRNVGALRIIDAKFRASIHTEIKLSQISVQVLLIHVLIHADEAALEDREEPFQGVGVHIAARPFELGVIDRLVLLLGRHDELVRLRAVGDQTAVLVQMFDQGTAHVAMIQVHGTDRAATLDQDEDLGRGLGIQRGPSGLAGLGRLRQIGFVGLDGLTFAADRAAVVLYSLPDAMAQEPGGFHAAAKHSLKLPGADAFLAGAHQVDDLEPQVQRQVAGFEDGAHADSERLLAGVALAEAGPSSFPAQAADAAGLAAMRADRAIGPEPRLNIFERSGFVLQVRSEQYGGCHV